MVHNGDWTAEAAVAALFLVLEPFRMLHADHRLLQSLKPESFVSNLNSYVKEMLAHESYDKLRR
jgi:hypothetical protein